MSYRSSNRFSPGFGIIKLPSTQELSSYKPEFSDRGIFNSATSYGSSETFASLTDMKNSGYKLTNETNDAGDSLITNNGDGSYTVSSNKITIDRKSMFCLKPNIKKINTKYAQWYSFTISNIDDNINELDAIISSGYVYDARPCGAEDCYSFSTSFWPVINQSGLTDTYISQNGYNMDLSLDEDNIIIIWRLL